MKRNILTDHTLIIHELDRSIKFYNLNFILSFLPKGSYLVGGYIRDIILGRVTEDVDVDIVVPLNALEIGKQIAKNIESKFIILDKKREVVRIFFNNISIDIANQITSTIEGDLKSRDFSINSVRFSYASEMFERNLFQICELNTASANPLNDLNNTSNTQICLFLVESILLDALKDNGFKPTYVAGHSLGEITALYCADVFSFEESVALIKVRSQLMVNAGKGSMAAVIGFDRNQLDLLVNKIDDIVIANDNSSSQVVLSGSNEALDNLSSQISCKRFLKLNVSGAFHSPFMKDPSEKFSKYLKQIKFRDPSFPVISNYKPSLCSDSNELKIRLENQMCHGVRWRETMDLMAKDTDLHIVEVGPSNVLSGLGKRHLKDVKISQVSSSDQIAY